MHTHTHTFVLMSAIATSTTSMATTEKLKFKFEKAKKTTNASLLLSTAQPAHDESTPVHQGEECFLQQPFDDRTLGRRHSEAVVMLTQHTYVHTHTHTVQSKCSQV